MSVNNSLAVSYVIFLTHVSGWMQRKYCFRIILSHAHNVRCYLFILGNYCLYYSLKANTIINTYSLLLVIFYLQPESNLDKGYHKVCWSRSTFALICSASPIGRDSIQVKMYVETFKLTLLV